MSIKDDEIPEDRESIVVFLKQPHGGAVLDHNSTAVIVIRASDHVAGRISCETDVFEASEGDTIPIQIVRSYPAKGRVVVPWTIVDKYNNSANLSNLNYNEGEVTFEDGDTKQNITLYAISDNVPEFDERYYLQLEEPQTYGVDTDGGAILNCSSVTISIKPSDNPHGQFGLMREVSRYSEDDPNPVLQVKRRGGTFGDVVITYNIEEAVGDPSPTRGQNMKIAQKNFDFNEWKNQEAVMKNGTWLLEIPFVIIADEEPELDEIFAFRLVNVKLTNDWIEQYGSSHSQPPSINPAMSSGFGVISANDGTLGVLEFRVAHLSLFEDVGSVDIVIDRHQGQFGNISVYIYASARTTVTSDFIFEDQTVTFAPGQSKATVNLTICDDDIPEPPEIIELILASPSPDGVVLGKHQRSLLFLFITEHGFFIHIFIYSSDN